MFKRTFTTVRSTRSSMRIAGSGLASAALVSSALVFAPTATAVTYTCNDDDATLSNDNTYCEIVFDTPGATTWQVPIGVSSLDLLLVGGGGGGGGGSVGDGVGAGGGDGGSGGAVDLELAKSVLAGASISLTVGEGGQGGDGGDGDWDATTLADGLPGLDGGDTQVTGDSLSLLAQGGAGGAGGLQNLIGDTTRLKTPVGGSGNGGSVSASGANGAVASTFGGQQSDGLFASDSNKYSAGGGGGGVFNSPSGIPPGTSEPDFMTFGDGGANSSTDQSSFSNGKPGKTATGSGGGGGGGIRNDFGKTGSAGDGGDGAAGVVVLRYVPIEVQLGGGGDNSGSGASPASTAPAVVTPALPSPTPVPGGAAPASARAVVNGEVVEPTVTPLVSQAAEGASNQQESSLPQSLRDDLPGPNGVRVAVGDVGVSLIGPQVAWPRSSDVLIVVPEAPLALQTSGFQPNTTVNVFVQNQSGTWVLVDALTSGPDGSIDAAVVLPADSPVGPGSLQLDGTDTSGRGISLAIGAQIAPPVAPVPTADGPLPQVLPGEASVTDAEGNPLVFSVNRVNGTDLEIRVGESLTSIQAVDADGLQPLAADGAIEIEEEGFVRVGGQGFQPNSIVQVWAFSEATFVGIVLTDENGAYTSLLELPEELELGDHTLQNSGTARNGQPLAVSAGLRIIAPGEGSTTQTGTQETARANTTVFFGRGSSTLDAADRKKLDRLVRRVKDSAQRVRVTGYVQASSSTANDQSLSTARARSVANYLRSQGVDAKYTVRGRGVLNAPSDEARSASVMVVYTK